MARVYKEVRKLREQVAEAAEVMMAARATIEGARNEIRLKRREQQTVVRGNAQHGKDLRRRRKRVPKVLAKETSRAEAIMNQLDQLELALTIAQYGPVRED